MTAPLQAVASAPPAPRGREALEAVARDFEAVFTRMLLKSMRATVGKSDLFHGGRGEDIFTDMLDGHLSGVSARNGRGLGLAPMIVGRYERYVREPEAGGRLDVTVGDSR